MPVIKANRQPKPRRARPASRPCVYRSEQITGTVGCKTCGGNVQRALYWCALHKIDVMTHPYSSTHRACSKCTDYKARTDD